MKKIIILVIMCLIVCANCIYAMPPSGLPNQTVNMQKIEGLGDKILGVIVNVGYTVSVAALMFIGIKLMLAAPSEKAQVKGMMIPYLVGAMLIFGTTSILNVIGNIANKIN